MACPYFLPTGRFHDSSWLKPPRLPLGDPCQGECTIAHAAPGPAELRDFCNTGYARGRCPHFPGDSATDAIRFSLAADHPESLELVYILESDYAPAAHGPITYDRAARDFTTAPDSPIVRAQARQFIDSYLNRKVKA